MWKGLATQTRDFKEAPPLKRQADTSHAGSPAARRLPSHLREVIEGLGGGLGPHCHPVHLVVEPIQEEAKKLLGILLTEPTDKRVSDASGPAKPLGPQAPGGGHVGTALTCSP